MKKSKRQRSIDRHKEIALQVIPGKYRSYLELKEYNPHKNKALFEVDNWIKYSSRETWYANIKVLTIKDKDSKEINAIRVSPNCTNIDTAINYLIPAEIKKSKNWKRQGDMFFKPQRIWNLKELEGSNHIPYCQSGRAGTWYVWKGEKVSSITIFHPTHKPLKLNTPHKVRQQITVFGHNSSIVD